MEASPLERVSDGLPPIPEMIGIAPRMQQVYRRTRRVAPSNASVLLYGETGTGKELIAKSIHLLSRRASGPFIRVNCGALAENLLESELFGHVRGSFTGAIDNRTGRFEAAHTGTIFLDEINSTSQKLQVKLLRVIQEHEFERVGDTQTIRVDTRVISASNRDLREEVEAGRFREDLYYRLNVVNIHLPPLRERREDIPALTRHFLALYSEKNDCPMPRIDHEFMRLVQAYDWPGNVRELQNYSERAVVLATGDTVTPDLLPRVVREGRHASRLGGKGSEMDLSTPARKFIAEAIRRNEPGGDHLHATVVREAERELIRQMLLECEGVQTKAAARLGMNRNTLHKKLKQYGLA